MEEEVKRSVSYKVLIKADELYFTIGTFVIRTYTGDIYYTPSQRILVSPDGHGKIIDHLAWHASGQVHIKHGDGTEQYYSIVQKDEERQKISEVGFQEMVHDIVEDYTTLPVYRKKVAPLDVVFDVGDHYGSVCFRFSIVSGKLIVATYRGQKVGIRSVNHKEDGSGLGSELRALGHHSGSGDVALQYSLRKTDMNDLRTGRRLLIPHDMKISKMNILPSN